MANVPLRPLGANFYGFFLCPANFSDSWVDGRYATWNFNADWKAPIDAFKAAGCNTIFWYGSVKAGNDNLATYIANRRQVIEYLASIGMFSLSYSSLTFTNWAGPTNAQGCTVFAADAAMLSQYPNSIGYVSVDEPWYSTVTEGGALSEATMLANIAAQYSAIKAVVPTDFPVCCAPNPGGDQTDPFEYTGAAQTRLDSAAPYCDFFCFHPFTPITLGASSALRTAYPGKDIILPSTVAALDSDSGIASEIATVMGLVGSNGFRGMGAWVGRDYDASTYGFLNADYTERATKVNAFRSGVVGSYPTRRVRTYAGNPRLNHHLRWGYQ